MEARGDFLVIECFAELRGDENVEGSQRRHARGVISDPSITLAH
jgi:hypothetical protein